MQVWTTELVLPRINFVMEMEPGVATITGPEDWEKATLHLWGVTLAELSCLFHNVALSSDAAKVKSMQLGDHIRQIIINPPIQRVSVTF